MSFVIVFWPAWRKACCALTDVFLIYIIKPKAETYWSLWSFYAFFRQWMEWDGVRSLAIWASLILGWTLNVLTSAARMRCTFQTSKEFERHTLPRRTRYVRRWSLATGPTLRRRFNRCWKLEDNIVQWYRLWFGHRWWAMVGLCFGEAREPNIGRAFGKWASTKLNDGK